MSIARDERTPHLAAATVVLCFCAIAACSDDETTVVRLVTPTEAVTAMATATASDTEVPTQEPTVAPTEAPTEEPTDVPTEPPTESPTEMPTPAPTPHPTIDLADNVAFLGAPPTMLHQRFGCTINCLDCHATGVSGATISPHPERRICVQCHLPQKDVELFRENLFEP